jgi:MFS family permease
MRTEAAGGLRYVLGHPYLRNIAACTGTLNLFGNIGGVMLLLYIVDELGISAGTVGVIFAIANLGVLLGALTAERLARWFGIGPTIVGSAFVSAFALVPVAIAPADNAVPFLVAAGIVGASTTVVYNVNQVSLRQAITPERMQGRMNATMRFIVWGTIPIGSLAGGGLGALIGLQNTIWVGAIGSFLGFLPVFFSRVRELRAIPEPEAS